MNLEQKPISFVVLITFIATVFLPFLFPSWKLNTFAPLLVIMYYQKSFLSCLWASLLCGTLIDLFSAHAQFGLHAVNYTFTTLLLYNQRRNFFADSLSTLPLMTFFFVSLSTLFQWILVYTFERENVFSWYWMATDLLYMPLIDSSFATCCFILPWLFFGKRQRKGKEFFLES